MEYKRYLGKTFQEAKFKMVLELGSLGYIISQKKVKIGGFLGFFKTPMIEILAGMLNQNKRSNGQNKRQELQNAIYDKKTKPQNLSNVDKIERPNEEKKVNITDFQDLKKEIFLMKTLLQKLEKKHPIENEEKIQETNLLNKPFVDSYHEFSKLSKGSSINKEERLDRRRKNLKRIQDFLKRNEFDHHFIQIICSLPSIQGIVNKKLSYKEIKNFLKKEILQILKVKKGINFESKGNVLCVVGPTGVGKTTTLAKLGAYFGLFEKRKIKFLSLDNYRIGGMQHIEFYSNIMNIDFKRIYHPDQFYQEIQESNEDIILVDTSGRSQKNFQEIKDIERYFKVVNKEKLHVALVVSATTKYGDLLEILEEFDTLNYQNLIVTKLDETNTMGPVLSAIHLKNQDLSYVTFGQMVPEDIEVATKNRWFERIFK